MLVGGVLGVLLVVVVATAGVPLPAELAIVYGGYLVESGRASAWLVAPVAWLGSAVGASILYAASRRAGMDAAGTVARRVGISRRQLRRAERWFDRGGWWTVVLARMIPGLRTVVSIPAGTCGMSAWSFLSVTLVGLAPSTLLLMWIGTLLGRRWEDAGSWISTVAAVVLGAAIVVAGVAMWRARRDSGEEDRAR